MVKLFLKGRSHIWRLASDRRRPLYQPFLTLTRRTVAGCMPHPSDHTVESDVAGPGGGVLLLILVYDIISWAIGRALRVGVRALLHDILDLAEKG